MKTIFLFVAGLFLINQTMAQCVGGTISGENSEICVSSTTGTMTVSGQSGVVNQWEVSTNGGSFWSIAIGGPSTTYSDVPITTGTFMYRVQIADGSSTCYSTTKSIEVKNANGGTISSGGGTLCTGNTPDALTLTSFFKGQAGTLYWEYSDNGGSTFTADGLGTNVNPYTPNLSFIGGAGTYIYRAVITGCGTPYGISSNTKTYNVGTATAAAVCDDADALRKAVAKVHITGIPYDFSGFLVNHSSEDGRLLFLTTSHPFTRYSPSSGTLNSATFTWNEDLSTCGGSAASTVTSTGCSVLANDGWFTLLELNAAPDLSQLYYLGWDISATGSYNSIFQSAGSIKKGKVSTSGIPGTVSGDFTSGTDDFVESSGSGVFKFSSWSSGNTEKRGRGAPLLAGSVGKKARGVYIGGTEANCGNGPSYFAYLHSGLTGLLSYLRDGSETNTRTVHMNYCEQNRNLSGNLNLSNTYSVAQSIVSTQNIANGITVRYEAGTYIELNNGFNSGTNFVAEIDPCTSTVTQIAAKTDDMIDSQSSNDEKTELINNTIKIYPTILASGNGINIQTSVSTDNLDVVVYDLQGKPVQTFNLHDIAALTPVMLPLNSLPANMYLVKVTGSMFSFTQKLIIQ